MSHNKDDKPIIGITMGDYNGIGPEVILKALDNNRILKVCTPVIYGSMRVISRYRKLYGYKDWFINQVDNIQKITHKKTNLVAVGDRNPDVQPGTITPEAGVFALDCLRAATEDLKAGKLDGLVTAPINKHNVQSPDFKFPGHTEYLANAFGISENLMLMVCDDLRIGLVTGHIALSEVSNHITRERIFKKAKILLKSLRQDFGILKPKVAVLGLNPHAGEDGLLGDEEQQIIRPAILEMKKKGELIYGPFSADSFFGTNDYQKFDAVLALYHDQGLIPFKAIAFERGVNFTAGLPGVRTSPDHGTAYNIAGKDLASHHSLLEAIFVACDVVRARQEQTQENKLADNVQS